MSKMGEIGEQPRVNRPMDGTLVSGFPANQTTTARQIVPAPSVMAAAQGALAGVDSFALEETLDNMSLALGSRLKDLKRRDGNEGTSRTHQALTALVEELDDPMLVALTEKFSQLGESLGEPLVQLRAADLPVGTQLLLLSSLLADKRLSDKRRQRLQDALTSLLEGEDWQLQLFAQLEIGQLPESALPQLRTLYQRSRREDQPQQGLSAWFAEIKEWPDRQRRIRILLRALAFDLSAGEDDGQQIRLAATISDLKRLLIFLGLEEHCRLLGRTVALSEEQVLDEILAIIDQLWIYPEWLANRLQVLVLTEQQQTSYLRRLRELLQLLPEPCFKDPEQREQILKALMTLQDQLDQQLDGV